MAAAKGRRKEKRKQRPCLLPFSRRRPEAFEEAAEEYAGEAG